MKIPVRKKKKTASLIRRPKGELVSSVGTLIVNHLEARYSGYELILRNICINFILSMLPVRFTYGELLS